MQKKKHSRWCYKTVCSYLNKKVFNLLGKQLNERVGSPRTGGRCREFQIPGPARGSNVHSSCSWNKQFQSASRSQVLPTTSGQTASMQFLCKVGWTTKPCWYFVGPWSPVWRRFFDELEANADFEETGVIWSYFRVSVTSPAAAFWICCSLFSRPSWMKMVFKATQKMGFHFTTKCSQKALAVGAPP